MFSEKNFQFTHQSDIGHKVRGLKGKKTEK